MAERDGLRIFDREELTPDVFVADDGGGRGSVCPNSRSGLEFSSVLRLGLRPQPRSVRCQRDPRPHSVRFLRGHQAQTRELAHGFDRGGCAIEQPRSVAPKDDAISIQHFSPDEFALGIGQVKAVQEDDQFVALQVGQREVIDQDGIVRRAELRQLNLEWTKRLLEKTTLERRVTARRFVRDDQDLRHGRAIMSL